MLIYFTAIFFFLGTSAGSFLNAAVLRWGRGESIVFESADGESAARKRTLARSRCPECGHVLSGFELIPVVSFVLQRGRCRKCQKQLSIQYLVVEIVAAVLGALPWIVLWFQSAQPKVQAIFPLNETQAVVIALFSWVLLFLFLYDLRYQIILDRVSLPAIVVAAAVSYWIFGRTWESVGLGMLVAGGLFALQFILSRGKWIGGGDIRMGVLMGALLGLPSTIAALFLTYIIGAAVALYLLATGRAKRDTKIALGTFIAVATFICLYVGDWIANWYLGLLGF
jgi:prepilin signal peptidase PulO-like enzyme (type II secretory pathway)